MSSRISWEYFPSDFATGLNLSRTDQQRVDWRTIYLFFFFQQNSAAKIGQFPVVNRGTTCEAQPTHVTFKPLTNMANPLLNLSPSCEIADRVDSY